MLTPEFLQAMPKRFVNLWSEVESDITAQIAKRMVKTDFTVGASSSWQIQKLLEMSKMDEDIVKELARATKKSEAEVRRAITESGFTGLNYDEQIYKRAGMDVNGVQYALTHSVALRDVLNAGVDKTNGVVKNFTRTTANTAQHAYYNAMDKAWIEIMSGAYSPQQAVAQSVKEIAEKGFESVAYPSGHYDKVDVAARRAILTGANQTTAQLQIAQAEEMGCDLVEVTSHAGARPTHAVWQGRIFSLSGKTKGYKDFYEETGYGTGEGLCGWNCRHSFYPYFEGLSSSSFSHDPAREYLDKSNTEMYEDSQRQRALERAVRQSKRACMALDASRRASEDEALTRALNDAYNTASVQLRNRRKALEDFAKLKDRTLDDGRIAVNGFGHSEGSKAAWAARKTLQAKIDGTAPTHTVGLAEIGTETKEITGTLVDTSKVRQIGDFKLTSDTESGTIGVPPESLERFKNALRKQAELPNDSSVLVNEIVEHHSDLKYYTPESMKGYLEEAGYSVVPLANGNFKGVPFEEGGGYKTNFGGDGIFQYHPEKRSHHNGAYWKIGNGKEKKRYDMDGNEIGSGKG